MRIMDYQGETKYRGSYMKADDFKATYSIKYT
jgi:hypothetical protein